MVPPRGLSESAGVVQFMLPSTTWSLVPSPNLAISMDVFIRTLRSWSPIYNMADRYLCQYVVQVDSNGSLERGCRETNDEEIIKGAAVAPEPLHSKLASAVIDELGVAHAIGDIHPLVHLDVEGAIPPALKGNLYSNPLYQPLPVRHPPQQLATEEAAIRGRVSCVGLTTHRSPRSRFQHLQ